MNLNLYNKYGGHRHALHKFLLVMKLIIILITTAILQVSASTYAQKITLNRTNIPLEKVMKEIRQQSGYDFFYDLKLIKNTKPISINVKEASLEEVLDKCFANQPLTYKIGDKVVMIKEKDISVLNKIKEILNIPITIFGKVTDTTGAPLSGATIGLKGKNIAIVTDEKGEFSISAQSGDQLVISFIGFTSQTITVTDNLTFQSIVLHSASSRLDEVIVSTGYQTIPRERATGSFAQPNKAMYEGRVSTDVISKLEGITSGLLFNANTSNTQSGRPDLNIRGRSTIFSNDQPLIVIDNFPYSGDINNINPNDIESVTILKDAAAASIWGVRAGNGVIVITTKKGKLNQELKIALNSNITIMEKPNLFYNPAQMNAADFIDMEEFLFTNGKYDRDLSNSTTFRPVTPVIEILARQRSGEMTTANATAEINVLRNADLRNDLTKYLYRRSVRQQHALSISGGSDRSSYYLSAGYDKNLQSLKANDYDRITVSSNLTFAPIKNLQITAGINYIQSQTTTDNTVSNLNTGGLYAAVYPYARLADDQGNPLAIVKSYRTGYITSAPSNGYLDWSYSPLKDLGLGEKTTKYNDIRLNPGIKYTLFKGLSVEGKYQFEQYSTNFRDFESQETFYTRNLINRYAVLNAGKVSGYAIPLGGILNQSLTNVTAYNLRGQVNYAGSWQKHSIDAIAGVEQNEIKTDGTTNSSLYGYHDQTGVFSNVNFLNTYTVNPGTGTAMIPNLANISGLLDRVRSYFGNAAYTFDDKYTASVSARIDGSNYFGVNTNQKSVPLFSFGGKWAIDHEKFYHLDWLPYLQFRTSYGYNGNLNRNVTGITTSRYQVNSDFTNLLQADISNIGNPELRWEKAGITNLGIDFATRNNRIMGSIEYFLKNGRDLIGDATVAPSTGTTVFRGNYAAMKGHGIDLQITTKNIDRAFSWSTTLLLSYATDKVTQYTAPVNTANLPVSDGSNGSIYPTIGKPVFGIWSYRWAGLDPANGDPQGYLDGAISKDYYTLENPASSDDLIYSGSARPLYFGGIYNRFSYRNFGLSFNISYKFGYYFRRSSLSYYTLFNNWIGGNKEFSARWKNAGDERTTNVPSLIYPADADRDNFYNYSAATVEKGDHIRLQDISLNYEFKRSQFKKLPFDALQLYAYANNIGILWRANKLKLDPDYPVGLPASRSFALGLKANF